MHQNGSFNVIQSMIEICTFYFLMRFMQDRQKISPLFPFETPVLQKTRQFKCPTGSRVLAGGIFLV
jgi:hypothetical protein